MSKTVEYINICSVAIITFQFIEEGIKMYLSIANQVIAKKTKNLMPYKYTYKDLEKIPLKYLIERFSRLNDNRELIKETGELRKIRNDIVHKCFVKTIEESRNAEIMESEIIKVKSIHERSKKCLDAVLQEVQKLKNTARADN